MAVKLLASWKLVQQFLSVDGGLYVDCFALVMIVRLVAVLFKFPPLTTQEAAIWGVTIASFGYSNGKPQN